MKRSSGEECVLLGEVQGMMQEKSQSEVADAQDLARERKRMASKNCPTNGEAYVVTKVTAKESVIS